MAAGYQIHVISHFSDSEIKHKLSARGMICHESRISEQSLNPLDFFRSLMTSWVLLKEIKPDVLHCITIKPCLMGGLFARCHNIPIISSFVGLGRVFTERSLHMNLIRWLTLCSYKLLFNNEKCLLTFEHEQDRNLLVKLTHVDLRQTIIINGAGIDPNYYRFSQETPRQKPVVLFASRLLWSKGLGDLVAVKQQLAQKGIEFDLNVAGFCISGDPDAIPMVQIEHWHQQGQINWLGKRSDVYSLIKASNVVALPSVYSEGIPRILLEAASVGRACIAYNVGGCQSLIIDDYNGCLVEKSNVSSLADKLALLLNSPDKRAQMGLRSRERVELKFASALIVNETLKLYRRAIFNERI